MMQPLSCKKYEGEEFNDAEGRKRRSKEIQGF